MALNMARPTKHPRTGIYRIRIAIPVALRDEAERLYGSRWELIEPLATKDHRAASAAAPAALARINGKLAAIRAAANGNVATLSERDVRAMGHAFYRTLIAEIGDNPGRAIDWEFHREALGEQVERGVSDDDNHPPIITPSAVDRRDAAGLLAARSIPADATTVTRVASAVFEAKWQVARVMERRAEGDWTPDAWEVQQPSPSTALTRHGAAASPAAVTFDTLLDGFALDRGWGRQDAKPISRPLYDRQRTLARLADFLGHRDAAKVTKADAVRWKEDMQRRSLAAATVRNDVSECSAVWGWAMRSGKLPDGAINPFAGILPPKAAKRDRAVRPFTDAEAQTILLAAREQRGLLRWLPWVCCLTGARLNEICQSAKEDVAVIDGVPVLRIHDDGDGRSVKNADSRRTVPLHPALIAEGFVSYVALLPLGSPLFPEVKPDKVFGQRAPLAGRKIARWLRALGITDPRISPSHSWRHHFMDAARRVSMPIEVRSAITGHSGKVDASAGYGDGVGSMLEVMASHLAKVPAPVLPLGHAQQTLVNAS